MFSDLKKIMVIMYEQMGNFSEEMEAIKRTNGTEPKHTSIIHINLMGLSVHGVGRKKDSDKTSTAITQYGQEKV